MNKKLTLQDIGNYIGCKILHKERMLFTPLSFDRTIEDDGSYRILVEVDSNDELVWVSTHNCKLVLRRIESITDSEFAIIESFRDRLSMLSNLEEYVHSFKSGIFNSLQEIDYLRSIGICIDKHLIDNDLVIWQQ